MSIAEIFASPWLLTVIIKALVVGLLVSLCASLLGVSLVLKRYSMIGDGLSHVGFGALAVSTLLDLGTDFSLEISIPIVIIAAFIILRVSESSKMSGDSAIAMISTGSMAVGVLIYSFTSGYTTDVCNSLFGSASIITLTDKDLGLSIVLSVCVIALFALFYSRIFAVTFDETFAKATGIRAELYKMLLALLTAVTVVLGMRMLGSIMISALIVFPTLTAMRLCKTFKSVAVCAACVATICFIAGFAFSCICAVPAGASVVLANIVAFTVFAIISKIKEKRRV